MKTIIKKITPDYAKKLLQKNTFNRPVNKPHVKYLSKQMSTKEWMENGEPIVVSKDGSLLDGQHRLLAVIESGFSYNAPVIFDIEKNAFPTFDTGKNRAAHDVLSINGFSQAKDLASITRRILIYENTDQFSAAASTKGVTTDRKYVTTNQKILEFALGHSDYLKGLVILANRLYSRQLSSFFTTSDFGFYIYLFNPYSADESQQLNEFMNKMTQKNLSDDDGLFWLFKKIEKARSNNLTINPVVKTAFVIKSWNAFVNDIPIKSLRWNKQQEGFPKPETPIY